MAIAAGGSRLNQLESNQHQKHMNPRQQSTVRRSGSLLIAVSFAMSLSAAHAASLIWDGNGATEPSPDGGSGHPNVLMGSLNI